MAPPIRVKVYGLSLTRRGYLFWVAAGAVLFVFLMALWVVLFAGSEPTPAETVGESPWALLWSFLRGWMPFLLVAAALLEALEIYVVLGRFRKAEAALAGAPPQTQPTVKEP